LLEKNDFDVVDGFFKYINALKKDPILTNQVACATELFLLSVCDERSSLITASETFDAVIFRKTVMHMEERITESISVEELALKQNVSVSYLKKIFNKYAGIGVHKYFIKSKITYACKLLKEGKTVFEVSDMLSFSTPNYFCLAFKREIGMTPSQFKSERLL
jgi:AraC-like DNA-binding protein